MVDEYFMGIKSEIHASELKKKIEHTKKTQKMSLTREKQMIANTQTHANKKKRDDKKAGRMQAHQPTKIMICVESI